MTNPADVTHRLLQRFAGVLGLLVLVAVFTAAVHHHGDHTRHACVVCTAAHSPAAAGEAIGTAPAPAGPRQPLPAPVERAPRATGLKTSHSRAPPSA